MRKLLVVEIRNEPLGTLHDRHAFIEKTLTNNHIEKQKIYKELADLNIEIIKSHANFICINVKENANKTSCTLEKAGIIVRNLASFGLENFIRVSIGLPEQNNTFISALKKIYNEILILAIYITSVNHNSIMIYN